MNNILLQVNNLKKYYPIKGGFFKKTIAQIKAVDDVSFSINKGEVLGLVGESGCGKSTIGATILRLEEATEGEVFFEGQNIFSLSNNELIEYRKKMQIIFQDPYASLNPRMTVADIISEPLVFHNITKNRKDLRETIRGLLDDVGLTSKDLYRYPHEFSGGQRQRIGIARALTVKPKLIIADEPVSALDVSIQAHVINMLQDLKQEFGLAYLFITHDLSVVRHLSDRIVVMYLGKFVELAHNDDMFNHPLHPYTNALLSAIPIPNPKYKKKKVILQGDVPSPADPPSGCRFHPRCPHAMDICSQVEPELRDYGNEHYAACHLLN